MSSILETLKHPKLTQLKTGVDKKVMNLAASWYIAMPSKDLGKKPKAIKLFGQSLVAWRNQNGHPVTMKRYCSHMGASLAIGQVVDGCIRCPYHHWRYDDSGKCVSIPEIDQVPPTARQATYVTVERYGYIWVWYGSVTPLFPLPEFPAAEDQRHNYMSFRCMYNTNTTVQRLVEGGSCDYYHTFTLHNQKISDPIQLTLLNEQHPGQHSQPTTQEEAWFKVLMEIPVNRYLVGPIARVLGLKTKMISFKIDVWPSGYRITTFTDDEERFKVLFCTTPVAENKTIGHYLTILKKSGKFWLDIPYYVLHRWQSNIISAEDMSIFNAENSSVGGAYVKHDRGVLKYREFYQRWVNKVE